LQTSRDSVYFLHDIKEMNSDIISAYSQELDKRINIERSFTKPLLKGDDVHRYQTLETSKIVIFPYKKIVDENNHEKAILYTEKELKQNFPNGYAYLKECESILRDRESGKFNIDGEWFQFGRKQGILGAEDKKLIQPDISMGCNFTFDKDGEYYMTTTLYGYVKHSHIKESYKYYLAILNSNLLWWYLIKTGTTLANGFFRFKPDYINSFPLPESKDIYKIKALESLADEITKAKKKNPKSDTKKLETQIDELVYQLYDLTEEEIKIIENEIGKSAPNDKELS